MTPLLEVSQVSKRFGGIKALDGVSVEVGDNEAVGLIGPNGAGKTTLFDCLTGLQRADSGHISFSGRSIDQLPPYQRARLGMGRTFQRVELFAGMTTWENLLVAEREHRGDGHLWKDLVWRGAPRPDEIDKVQAMVYELGLGSFADAPVESLTIGQSRLVALGRTLLTEPRLLLLDEPSSGLDSRESLTLGRVLNDVRDRRSISLLLVEHDLDLVHAVVPRAYVLDFGRIIASGPLDDVLSEASVRSAYLGVSE
jgi:branched-chain amino acid transport system ATP-binding protein